MTRFCTSKTLFSLLTLKLNIFTTKTNLWLTLCFICKERKGRTIHLLKASSKPVPQERKRRKIDIAGTFQEYKSAMEEQKQEEPAAEETKKDAANEES